MNYIVLEGFALYLTFILVFALVLISLGCLVCLIFADKLCFFMSCTLKKLALENQLLNKANLTLKIKHGEFEIDER